MTNLADRLAAAVKEKKSYVCVGLDPKIRDIPPHIKARALREHGNTPEAVASAFVDFNTILIDKTHDLAAAFKPNVAFYEPYGETGYRAFKRTVDYARSKGVSVIADGKRNDIGSTTMAYADAFLGEAELIEGKQPGVNADALTTNPYIGTDTIKPFQVYCNDRGIFIICRTSNPSAAEVQDRLVLLEEPEIRMIEERLRGSGLSLMDLPVMKKKADAGIVVEGKAPLYVVIASLIDGWGKDLLGECGYSSVGAVVGATYPAEARVLRRLMPKTWQLVPGYGTQGGKAEDIPAFVCDDGLGAIVNASSSINFAYKGDAYKGSFKPEQFGDASRAATIAMRDDITQALQKVDKWRF